MIAIHQIDPGLVEETLEHICSCAPFRSSNQCQALLRYIVKNSLSGRDELLKERVIGTEVFGRPASYDCGNDPIVRTRAAEIRKRLAQYYLQSGSSSSLRIEVPSGGYRATFEAIESRLPATDQELSPTSTKLVVQPESSQEISTHIVKPAKVSKARWSFIAVAIFLLAGVTTALVLHGGTASQDNYQTFWQPMLLDRSPTMVYLGTNNSFRLTSAFLRRYRDKYKLADSGFDQAVDISREEVSATDLSPNGPLIGLGDTAAASRIASTLTNFHKSYDMRYGQDLGVKL